MEEAERLRVNLPFNPNPGRPVLVAPPGSWDTHFHVFVPHLFGYDEARRYTPPAAPVEHFLAISSAIGLSRGVVVQPSVHGRDTRVTVDAIRKSDGRLLGIIRDDPALTVADMKRLHAGGVRGVRFSSVASLGDQFDSDLFAQIVSQMEELNWVVDVHFDEASLIQHAEMISKVKLPLIIDAWARVDPRKGFKTPGYRTLESLLAQQNIYLKITAANRFIAKGVPVVAP